MISEKILIAYHNSRIVSREVLSSIVPDGKLSMFSFDSLLSLGARLSSLVSRLSSLACRCRRAEPVERRRRRHPHRHRCRCLSLSMRADLVVVQQKRIQSTITLLHQEKATCAYYLSLDDSNSCLEDSDKEQHR